MRDVNVAVIGCGCFGRLQLRVWQSVAGKGAGLVAEAAHKAAAGGTVIAPGAWA